MKTDYDAGRPLEVQTQFIDVYELGKKAGLEMPGYRRIVEHFGYEA
jgi:ketopantoate reductase